MTGLLAPDKVMMWFNLVFIMGQLLAFSGYLQCCMVTFFIYFLYCKQGEVLICGRERHGLVDDEEISGLQIGLVKFTLT